jgi:DNA-binding HxlR family transcriptional regulator
VPCSLEAELTQEQDRKDRLADFLSSLPPHQAQAIRGLDAEMQRNGKSKDAPVREIMALLGDKWSHLILLILDTGTLGHAQLKRAIELTSFEEAISQRVLTLKLRHLERNALVARSATNDVPPKVDYALTARGAELVSKSREIVDWISANSSDIENARRSFDQQFVEGP